MSEEQNNLFGTNQTFKNAVGLINNLDSTKFQVIAQRIIKKLACKNEGIFSEEEETQLQQVLGLNAENLHSILDSCSFIFEQSAYYGITPELLALQLEKVGVATQKVQIFEQVWQTEAKELVEKLRNQTVAPLELVDVNWRLHLQIGQSSLGKLKEPSAIFELGLKKEEDNKIKGEDSMEYLRMEFTHNNLYDFFSKLEIIQEQLDSLS